MYFLLCFHSVYTCALQEVTAIISAIILKYFLYVRYQSIILVVYTRIYECIMCVAFTVVD